MESKAEYKLRLEADLLQVGNEIGKLIARDKAAMAIRPVSKELEALELNRLELEAKLNELPMLDDEVWNAVKEVTHAIVE